MSTKGISTRFRFTLILLGLISSSNGWGSAIDVMGENTPGSVSQVQGTETETRSPSTSEAFLEQVRINSRLQAAEASFKLNVIAANQKNFTSARALSLRRRYS